MAENEEARKKLDHLKRYIPFVESNIAHKKQQQQQQQQPLDEKDKFLQKWEMMRTILKGDKVPKLDLLLNIEKVILTKKKSHKEEGNEQKVKPTSSDSNRSRGSSPKLYEDRPRAPSSHKVDNRDSCYEHKHKSTYDDRDKDKNKYSNQSPELYSPFESDRKPLRRSRSREKYSRRSKSRSRERERERGRDSKPSTSRYDDRGRSSSYYRDSARRSDDHYYMQKTDRGESREHTHTHDFPKGGRNFETDRLPGHFGRHNNNSFRNGARSSRSPSATKPKHSVFNRLGTRGMNNANGSDVRKISIDSDGRSRFEPKPRNIKIEVPNSTESNAFDSVTEVEEASYRLFGQDEDSAKLAETMRKRDNLQKMVDDLISKEDDEKDMKLINELRAKDSHVKEIDKSVNSTGQLPKPSDKSEISTNMGANATVSVPEIPTQSVHSNHVSHQPVSRPPNRDSMNNNASNISKSPNAFRKDPMNRPPINQPSKVQRAHNNSPPKDQMPPQHRSHPVPILPQNNETSFDAVAASHSNVPHSNNSPNQMHRSQNQNHNREPHGQWKNQRSGKTYGDYCREREREKAQNAVSSSTSTSTNQRQHSTDKNAENRNRNESSDPKENTAQKDQTPIASVISNNNIDKVYRNIEKNGSLPTFSISKTKSFRIPKFGEKQNSPNDSRKTSKDPTSSNHHSSHERAEQEKSKSSSKDKGKSKSSNKEKPKRVETQTTGSFNSLQSAEVNADIPENTEVCADSTINTESIAPAIPLTTEPIIDVNMLKNLVKSSQLNQDLIKEVLGVIETTGKDAHDSAVSSSTSKPPEGNAVSKDKDATEKEEIVSNVNKEPRTPTSKRRNRELESLSADLRDNFEEVLTATGKRSCTITSTAKSPAIDNESEEIVRPTGRSKVCSKAFISDSDSSSDESDSTPSTSTANTLQSQTKSNNKKRSRSNGSDRSTTKRLKQNEILSKFTESDPKIGFECRVVLERLTDGEMDKWSRAGVSNVRNTPKNTNKMMTVANTSACSLCKFSHRQNLVGHYNSVHKGQEVYCARMSLENSKRIRTQPPQEVVHCGPQVLAYCYYCEKDVKITNLSRFIEHFVSHTGDYNRKCTKCGIFVDATTEKTAHCSHSDTKKISPVEFTDSIYVYMCNLCNYTQIQERHLKQHISQMHEINTKVSTQYKKVVLAENLRSNTKPKNQSKTSKSSTKAATPRGKKKNAETLVERLSKRLKHPIQVKSEAEVSASVLFRGNEFDESATNAVKSEDDVNRLGDNDAVESVFKIEVSKEEPNPGDQIEEDDQEWESCSTDTEDDDNNVNDSLTRLNVRAGKMKGSTSKKMSAKKRNRKSLKSKATKLDTSDDDTNDSKPENNQQTKRRKISIEIDNKDLDAKRIDNIAYSEFDGQRKYFCYIGNCDFISLNNPAALSNHLRKHNEPWTGLCHTCDKQVLNGSFSLMKEYKHLMEIHLPELLTPDLTPTASKVAVPEPMAEDDSTESMEIEAPSAEPESEPEPEPEPQPKSMFRLKVRRLSGDMLSGNQPSVSGLMLSNPVSLGDTLPVSPNFDRLSPDEDSLDSYNPVKPWTSCTITKSPTAIWKLQREVCLVALFKCMAIDCIFTTSCRDKMLKHLENHEEFLTEQTASPSSVKHVDTSSWLECCYCEEVSGSCTMLVNHIESEHTSSIFQCSHCFYRSVDSANVGYHIEKYHGETSKVIICGTRMKNFSEDVDVLMASSKELQKIKCTSPDCNMLFIHIDEFRTHLSQSHADKNFFRCPACPMRLSKNEYKQIDITHFNEHNISLCHCAYCSFSSIGAAKMTKHLCDEHPTRMAYALIRMKNGSCDSDNEASIARAYDTNKKTELSHSNFTLNQVNFMSPSLSEYLTNSGDVPADDAAVALDSLKREANFKLTSSSHRREIEQFHKQYNVHTFDELIGGTWKVNGERSIQNEIDLAAKSLVKGTGVDNQELYRCGFDGCTWVISNGHEADFVLHLNEHQQQDPANPSFKCFHCTTDFTKSIELRDHIVSQHSEHTFFCYFCLITESTTDSMYKHFRDIHNDDANFLPLNPSQKGIFVACASTVTAIDSAFGLKLIDRHKNRMLTKKTYRPDEVDLLPNCHIFADDLQCELCLYQTKVRTNMVRHLQSCDGRGEGLPEMAPVNPVPCLDTGERHFDRMKNLAASSNQSSSIDPIFKFVPSKDRYHCGAIECFYRTHTPHMLRTHIEALHQSNISFTCFHCPTQFADKGYVNADVVMNHLRFHDNILYKCSVCAYMHSSKTDVEGHIRDLHPNTTTRTVETLTRPMKKAESVKPPIKSNVCRWKCNICSKTIFNTKQLVKQHLSTEHHIEYQYQCHCCSFQDDNKTRVKNHLTTAHNESDANKIRICYEPIGIDIDNTPIWRRDDPNRIKHIRGILFEDEDQMNKKPSTSKTTKSTIGTGPTNPSYKKFKVPPIPQFSANASKTIQQQNNSTSNSNRDDGASAARNTTRDQFMILPPKENLAETAMDRPRPASLRRMPQRRQSMFVSSPSEFLQSTSTDHPPISIRIKRITNPISVDDKMMPPPSTMFKVIPSRKEIDSSMQKSLIYLCNYCSVEAANFDEIHSHWCQIHKDENFTDPEANQFLYRVTMKVQCIYCIEHVTFYTIQDHIQKMHPTKLFAFARPSTAPSENNSLQCGVCPLKLANDIDLIRHFRSTHEDQQRITKIQPMPLLNDQIIDDLLKQGEHKTIQCLYCDQHFLCANDFKKHHDHEHALCLQMTKNWNTNKNCIKYECSTCNYYHTDENAIIVHIRENHAQPLYQCLHCTKKLSDKAVIRAHHELVHNTTEIGYRTVDAHESLPLYNQMKITFSNGLTLIWGDIAFTKYGRLKHLVDVVNKGNEIDRQKYIKSASQSSNPSSNVVTSPGRIGNQRRQTHLLQNTSPTDSGLN